MADLKEFESQLEVAVPNYGTYLEEKKLPQLKENFRSMKSSFDAVHTLLQKKSLIKQDPYNYEEHISDIDVPPDDDFLESEQDSILSVRLAKYAGRLDYLLNYFQFSLETLDLLQLKKLVKFIRYINWRNLTETSSQPTTRGLAIILTKIKAQHDQLSVNIVTDAREQLNSISKKITDILKAVTTYQRENYKLLYRQQIIPALGSLANEGQSQMDTILRKSKGLISRDMPGQPLVRELILEVFAENEESDTGNAARETILAQLEIPDEPAKRESTLDLKPMLLDAARAFAGCGTTLDHAMKKLADNVLILESRKLNFGEVLKRIWKRMHGGEEEKLVFQIEFLDPETASRHRESVEYDAFRNGVARRARIYTGILSRSGAAWKKVNESSEEKLLDYLSKEAIELQVTLRRLESLETYLKTEVPREQRNRLGSFGNEVVAIRDSISQGKKKLHSYLSKFEEIEQLKKLGINPNA